MHKQYGKKKGEEVFYASANKGTIKGVHGEDIDKYATEEEKEMLKEDIEKYGTKEEIKELFGSKRRKEIHLNIQKKLQDTWAEYSKSDPRMYQIIANECEFNSGGDDPNCIVGIVYGESKLDALNKYRENNGSKPITTPEELGDDLSYVHAKPGLKKINKEDIEKYGTKEEKQFLKEAGVYDLPVDPDFTRKRLAKKQLRKTLGSEPSAIEKDLSNRSGAHGENFLSPFDKAGQPRQYLKILLALEDNPEGLTKMEILNDVLGKNLSKEQARGWGSSGLWSPLLMAGLLDSEKDGKVTKYFTGPKWPEYRKNVLGLSDNFAETGE